VRLRAILVALLLGLSLTPFVPSASAALTCQQIAAGGPQGGHGPGAPPPAPRLFAADFRAPLDCEWGFPLGGWGGVRKGLPARHDPVVFVHGNHSDAVDWYGVADAFRARGYSDQELWAVSYNGLGGQVDGAPICVCPPTRQQLAYSTRPDVLTGLATGGQYAANDVNVRDLASFVDAVLAYTRAKQVQLVGHSLGVTVIRKTLFDYPRLMPHVSAVVSIAGGNHGTSLCRGSETLLYSCDEIAPNTAWLKRLNGRDETPGRISYLSIYNGTNNLDPFFVNGPGYDDRQSPHLAGAINLTYPDAYHSDLRVRPDIVATYVGFLVKHGSVKSDR
jgi:pimeloyl-ACP methyl ester carboxylesterase